MISISMFVGQSVHLHVDGFDKNDSPVNVNVTAFSLSQTSGSAVGSVDGSLQGALIVAGSAGVSTFDFSAMDSNGLTDSGSIEVTVNALPAVRIAVVAEMPID